MRGKAHGADFRARSSTSWMLTARAFGRAHIAELLDLFQQLHDPAGFGDDQVGQLQILAAGSSTEAAPPR
jgi:hypothetical protein